MNIIKRFTLALTFLLLLTGNVFAATDQILATEEMVGSGHASKDDTLNRALNKLTTAGDIPYATAAQTVARLGIGAANYKIFATPLVRLLSGRVGFFWAKLLITPPRRQAIKLFQDLVSDLLWCSY